MSYKKVLLVTVIIVSLAAMLSACQTAEQPAPETITIIETVVVEGTPQIIEKEVEVTAAPKEEAETSKEGGVFTWGMPAEFPGFNPILNDEYTELYMFGLTSEPLTWGGENYPTELKPVLAESWETSEDGLVWTLHLKEGVKWQDGVDFTAEDVVFWANTIQDEATGEKVAWLKTRFEVNGIAHVFEAIDDYTVQDHYCRTRFKPSESDLCSPDPQALF